MTSSITLTRDCTEQLFLSGVLLRMVPNPDVCWNHFSWKEPNEVCVDGSMDSPLGRDDNDHLSD